MTINTTINTILQTEKDLHEDLIIEVMQQYGHEFYFLRRTDVVLSTLLDESHEARFDDAVPIEMYIENIEGFEGEGSLLTQFGLQIKDQANFIVSKKRFTEELGEIRPLEGDLIYYPLTKSLFEIKFVEHEKPFFELDNLNVFQLNCELFDYADEEFDTAIDEINDIETDHKVVTMEVLLSDYDSVTPYDKNEFVYIGPSLGSATFTAEVKSFDGNIFLVDTTGTLPIATDIIIGDTSGATYTIASIVTGQNPTSAEHADNQDLVDLNVGDDLMPEPKNPFGDI